ncbi:MAG: hypothetical protein COA73_17355, partial [Candidatus Hydrogenedentota bacterium]
MWFRDNDKSNNTRDTQDIMNTQTFSRVISTVLAALVLQACSGGSGGGGSQQNAADVVGGGDPNTGFTYTGPVAANTEIQSFKREFYDNLVIDGRCGDCHTSGGPGTTAFVDRENVNDAWQLANTVVNLDDPAASAVVQRVANGHNCWLGADQTASCQSAIIGYIQNWASGAQGGTSAVKLLPRTPVDPTGTKITPDDHSETPFYTPPDSDSLYGLLSTYCAGCHTPGAAVPQSPYFANTSDVQAAYEAVQSKINLINPENSRVVVRLRDEQHQCWSDCALNATALRSAIEAIAAGITIDEVDENLLISKAQVLMTDGILASAGGRYEEDIIGEWKFSEGINPLNIADCLDDPQCNLTSSDTSGVQPEITLTLSGDFELLSSGGVRFSGGNAKGLATTSEKLTNRLAGA